MIGDLDMAIGRHDEHGPRLEALGFVHGAHRQGAAAGENLTQAAGATRVEVLGDDDRRREIGRQRRYQRGQRLDAARGRAHDDEMRKRACCLLRDHADGLFHTPRRKHRLTPILSLFGGHQNAPHWEKAPVPERRVWN